MNQNTWEQAQQKKSKQIRFTLLTLLPLLIISGIIIFNNKDVLVSTRSENQLIVSSDSTAIIFAPDSLIEDKYLDTPADSQVEIDTFKILSPDGFSKTTDNDFNEEIAIIGKKEPEKPAGTNKDTLQQRRSIDRADNLPLKTESLKEEESSVIPKKIKKINNIDSSRQYSILLTGVDSRVRNRKDIFIRLALELFYKDSESTRDILIKREDLKIVAKKIVQSSDLNAIKKESLASELVFEMNNIFDRKTITKVIIREFQIEKADAQ